MADKVVSNVASFHSSFILMLTCWRQKHMKS